MILGTPKVDGSEEFDAKYVDHQMNGEKRPIHLQIKLVLDILQCLAIDYRGIRNPW